MLVRPAGHCSRPKCIQVCAAQAVEVHRLTVVVVESQSCVTTALLPLAALLIRLLQCVLGLVDSLRQLLDRSVVGLALRLNLADLLLKFLNVLRSSLEDGALVLLGTGYDLRDVLYSFVDYLSSAALNYFNCQYVAPKQGLEYLPSL